MSIFCYIILTVFVLYLVFGYLYFRFAFRWAIPKTHDDPVGKEEHGLDQYHQMLKDCYHNYLNEELEDVSIKSYDGLKLFGKFYDAKSKYTMLLVHGYHSSDSNDFSCVYPFYKSLGFNILLIVQRSHRPSEGKYITFGIKERFDVISWVNYINSRVKGEIIISSVSMGSGTVLMATGLEMPKNVKGIIADCGYTSPADIIKKVAHVDMHLPDKIMMPVVNFYCRLLGKFSVYDASAKEALKNNEIPVLFIHGDSDTFVPCEMSKINYNVNKGEKELLIIKNADHALSYLTDKHTVENAAKKFISKQLGIKI